MTTRKPVVRLAGALVGSLVLAVLGGVQPATAAADARAVAVEVADTAEDAITVEDLRGLVLGFEASGDVTFAGARRLEFSLMFAEHGINRGTPASAILALEQFKLTAAEPRYVPSASARTALIDAADALIVKLRAV